MSRQIEEDFQMANDVPVIGIRGLGRHDPRDGVERRRHEITHKTTLDETGMTIVSTCLRCRNSHTTHFPPEVIERITLKNEQRNEFGINNEMDKRPCVPGGE